MIPEGEKGSPDEQKTNEGLTIEGPISVFSIWHKIVDTTAENLSKPFSDETRKPTTGTPQNPQASETPKKE